MMLCLEHDEVHGMGLLEPCSIHKIFNPVVFVVFFWLGPRHILWLMAYFIKKKNRKIWTYYSKSISLLKQIYLKSSPTVNHWSHSLPFTLQAHILGDPFQQIILASDPLVIHSAPLGISPFKITSGHDPPVGLQGCHFGQHPMEHLLGRSLQVSWAFFFSSQEIFGGFYIDRCRKFLGHKNLILPCFSFVLEGVPFLGGKQMGGLLFWGEKEAILCMRFIKGCCNNGIRSPNSCEGCCWRLLKPVNFCVFRGWHGWRCLDISIIFTICLIFYRLNWQH